MNIFGTDTYRTKLAEALENSTQEITLISAYITIEGIEWILDKLRDNVNCRVLSRWNCHELVNGASDIEVFEKLSERGFSLYILPDLHAKVTVIDDNTLFLGSANITNSGLRLVPGGNKEIGTVIKPDEQDLNLIETLFNEAVFITEEIYQNFYEEILLLKKESPKTLPKLKWSQDLQNKLFKPPTKLWVAETLWCECPDQLLKNINSDEAVHDLALLGFDPLVLTDLTRTELQNSFLQTRIWKWLIHKLACAENNEMYYGELSKNLHNSFLDDPTPYRRTVKGLLSNLLEWTISLGSEFILIDKPNHSQRVTLKNYSK